MGEYLSVDLHRFHPHNNIPGSPRFFVTESCVNTRREIPLYREVPNKISNRGDAKWMPYKHNDHAVDADRYALMSRPYVNTSAPVPKPTSRWVPPIAKDLEKYYNITS